LANIGGLVVESFRWTLENGFFLLGEAKLVNVAYRKAVALEIVYRAINKKYFYT